MENNDTKICLMVIYNHRYDKNIPRVEELYKGKFSHIFHIMPFYDENKENVIPVYENSFYFSNYIAQAYQHLKNKGFTHFFVVADDMILNPAINENSLWDETGIKKDECYISGFLEMHNVKRWWGHIVSAIHFRPNLSGTEVSSFLPNINDAQNQFKKFGVECKPLSWKLFLSSSLNSKFRILKDWPIKKNMKWPIKRNFDYPLLGGYSDIVFITAGTMEKFAQYCGIFAATRLFVEIAIPTSLALSAEKICFGNNALPVATNTKCIGNKAKLIGKTLWTKKEFSDLAEKYQNSLSELLKNYPKDTFFLHPVKLSMWK